MTVPHQLHSAATHGFAASALPHTAHLTASVSMLPDTPLTDVRSAFSSDGLQYAISTPDGRVRTFDTVTGRLQTVVSVGGSAANPSGGSALSNGHLADAKQCIAWLEVPDVGSHSGSALVAVGTSSGTVQAYSSADGKLKWSTEDCAEGGVVAVCSSSRASQQLWAAGRDGQVACMHSRKGTQLQQFKGSKHGATAAALSADGTKLLLGSSSLVLLDAQSGARLAKFTGHPGELRAAAFSPAGSFAVSAGSGERSVAVWPTAGGKAAKKAGGLAAAQLPVADPVQQLQTAAATGEDFYVAALTERGQVVVWWCSPSSEAPLSAKQVARVSVGSSSSGGKKASSGSSSSELIMAFHLDSNKKGNASLLVVRGTFVKPVFERVPLNAAAAAAASAEPQAITLAPTQGGVLLADTTNAVAGAGKAGSKAALANGPAAAAKVLGPDNEGTLVQQRVAAAAAAAGPGRRKRAEPEPDTAADVSGTAAAAAAELDGLAADSDEEALAGQEATLGQRVAAMEQRQQQYQLPAKGSTGGASAAAAEGDEDLPDAAAAGALPVGSLKADSLVTLLQQALRSADRSLLERCLNVSNPRVINNSVRRLVPMDAAALLREAVARLQSKPSRGQQLAAWVRAVLVYHTAYLMSAPGVQPVLTSLYQTIEARLALQRSLLSLAGRLDLLLAQAPASAEEGAGADEGPQVVYEESDSEEEVEVEDVFGEGAMYSDDDEDEDEEEDEEEEEGSEDAMEEDSE